MSASVPSRWFPDRAPTWSEVLLTPASVFMVTTILMTSPGVSWPAVALGVVLTVTTLGPFTATASGRRFDDWGRKQSPRQRAAVILLFAGGVWLVAELALVPPAWLTNAAVGVLLGTAVYVVGHVADAGTISGWRPT